MNNAETLDVLALAYALLRDSRWWRGDPMQYTDNEQCALSALRAAWNERTTLAQDRHWSAFQGFVQEQLPGEWRGAYLPRYNDRPGGRKRDVLRLFERAAAKIGK